MSRRTLATTVVFALLIVTVSLALLLPVPYVTMSPGPTVDVLAKAEGKPIIEVEGHKTYPTEGDLRLTTVSVTNPNRKVGLGAALRAWLDGARAVYPRDVIYPPDQSAEDVQQQSSVEMVGSQDTAIAAALTELGYKLPLQTEILAVTKGSAADGELKVRDRVLEVDGQKITKPEQVGEGVQKAGVGKAVEFVVQRGKTKDTVSVKPRAGKGGKPLVGVQLGTGYDFPFDVSVKLDDDIGGPSAGLIFSLGVYDTLTPGSLTGGSDVAGTGTIDQDGRVGPIGGIQQKIVAAAAAGAKIFLVPPDNCDDAMHADVTKDEIELVKAPTMHSAVESLEKHADDPRAKLPAC